MTHHLVPNCADLAGDVVVDAFDDMVNPPGLTNHWATAQVDHDVVAVRSLNVPPVSQGDSISGQLYLGGRLARSYGRPVNVRWRPDRVERTTTIDDWEISTVTVCPPGEPGVVVEIEVTETTGAARELRLGVWLASTVTKQAGPWRSAEPPQAANTLTRTGTRVVATDGSATAVQELVLPDGVRTVDGPAHLVEVVAQVPAGATVAFGYVHAVAADPGEAAQVADRLAAGLPDAARASEAEWDRQIAAMFDPDDDEFGGSLPLLETSDDALRRLYWWGAVGVLWFKRDNPASVLGRTYDTLMPRYWQTTTFIWDYSLSSQVHALLDPGVMRRQIAHWVGLDIDKHFGTEWLTGGPVGYWYSVNHYAMTRLVRDYVAFTGDRAFLDEALTAADGVTQRLADDVRMWARAWHRIRSASGLADYGEIDNLLECVSSYVHEVASLNAANVWCLRTAADLAELEGDAQEAAVLRAEAEDLVGKVKDLYLPGSGYFHARQPDGSLVPTRHCYDFATVGTTIAADLPERVRDEMVRFFTDELRTPSWMRALSPFDADAGYSLRADHQWNGAYPAWPPDAARSAIALGHPEVVLEWLPGLARSANQGPPGQAHFVEEAAEPVNGGARKTPPQFPYLIDWSCSSAGSWVELVISGIFGVHVAWDGTVSVDGCVEQLDPQAALRGLRVGGVSYDVVGDRLRRS
ncbi:hypothetical protein EXU48_07460 [Occultella glacieicola]|uniref:Alpha-L-rhamnosidase six-hairpin glycosidase domain-containing protein n=1 Tax=Occultella glacieicola TaxID=2518684 RepID=A0ABY2E648_9MICO|nr:hypothetical protein [Occultella glacieicola]TDE96065.1 hypothetical protein EXU48_07460 [Occultella glacieicola]